MIKIHAILPFEARKFDEIEKENNQLQTFVRKLEKKFHDIIWYIGIDFFNNEMYERFTFNSGGFMEIKLGKTELNAYFETKEQSEKFVKALKKLLGKRADIKVKEAFIKLEDVL